MGEISSYLSENKKSFTDSMVLPVTSYHVSSTSCESCEFSSSFSFELLYVQ